jgi:hypothetical protein
MATSPVAVRSFGATAEGPKDLPSFGRSAGAAQKLNFKKINSVQAGGP